MCIQCPEDVKGKRFCSFCGIDQNSAITGKKNTPDIKNQQTHVKNEGFEKENVKNREFL